VFDRRTRLPRAILYESEEIEGILPTMGGEGEWGRYAFVAC
jgi:hypothetical protein